METSKLAVAVSLWQLQQENIITTMLIYNQVSSVDIFWPQKRQHIARRQTYLLETIPNYTLDDFKSHFRLSRRAFEATCRRLSPLPDYNKQFGPAPNVEKDLLMFLWFIGNLGCIRSMADRFGVSKSSFHLVIKRAGTAISKLMQDVIAWPRTVDDFDRVCSGFGERSQFQNVIGAIDGSHIHITAPKHLHQAYYNRKGFYSIILLASCNVNMVFNYIWTGNPGSTHDATVLRSTDLFDNSENIIPPGYYLLVDSAFPILRWLITPFRDCGNLTRQQKLFNKTHSKCRSVIERAFGLLKCRFRRLFRFEVLDMSILVNSILSACVLHNICISENDEFEDVEDDNDCHVDDMFAREGHNLQGVQIRQQLMNQLFDMNG